MRHKAPTQRQSLRPPLFRAKVLGRILAEEDIGCVARRIPQNHIDEQMIVAHGKVYLGEPFDGTKITAVETNRLAVLRHRADRDILAEVHLRRQIDDGPIRQVRQRSRRLEQFFACGVRRQRRFQAEDFRAGRLERQPRTHRARHQKQKLAHSRFL
ncbi:MAG: hypothetical protein AAFR28_05610 [Pseudomonadota bacterium]